MQFRNVLALVAALCVGSTALAKAPCPKWEPGARYPWQSNEILRGDRFAWLFLDVDRGGYPVRCRFGNNNHVDGEARVWLCKQYYEFWRGPRAAASDPAIRTLQRYSLIPGYEHDMADKKARKMWFKQYPEQRPECYPEPSRPDRMDL